MDSIGELPWSLSSFESDTFWSLSLKRSLTNAPCPDERLEDIRSSVALPRRIEEMRFGPARHSTGLIQRFDRLKELLLLQDQFQELKWFRASTVVSSRYYTHDNRNQVCECDLFFERVASSVSTGELWPCAHNMATSITPRSCYAREVCEHP